MQFADLIKRLTSSSHNANGSAIHEDIVQLLHIQSALYQWQQSSDIPLNQFSDSLLQQLSLLKVELDWTLLKDRPNEELKATQQQLSDTIDSAIKANRCPAEDDKLIRVFSDYISRCQAQRAQQATRKKRKRQLLMLVTLAPFAGWGLHLVNGHLVQPVLLDEVHMVYPHEHYEMIDGVYRLPPQRMDEVLSDFQKVYFRDYYPEVSYEPQNYLPGQYDIRRDPLNILSNTELTQTISRTSIYAFREDADTWHFNHVRLYLRNIKSNNIVDSLRITAEPLGTGAFPWRELDLTPQIRFHREPNGAYYMQFGKAPVQDLTLTVNAISARTPLFEPWHLHQDEMVSTALYIEPDWTTSILYGADDKRLFYISADLFNQHSLPKMSTDDLKAIAYNDRETKQMLSLACDNGSALVFASHQQLAQSLSLTSVDSIEFTYEFTQLDDQIRKKRHVIETESSWLLPDGVKTNNLDLARCVSRKNKQKQQLLDLLLSMQLEDAYAASQSPSRLLYKASSWLTKPEDLPTANIASELSAYFVPLPKGEYNSTFFDMPMIMQDGEYLVLNLWVMGFNGGDYRFNIHINNQPTAAFDLNILWPKSFYFKQADKKRFKAKDD